MGKPAPPRGMYRESVHDGSSVTNSILRIAPQDGMGNHSKTMEQRKRRHSFFKMVKEASELNQRMAIISILAIYRGEFKTWRI